MQGNNNAYKFNLELEVFTIGKHYCIIGMFGPMKEEREYVPFEQQRKLRTPLLFYGL